MNVLVTGANGTVGTALRDHLEPDRYDVTWLDIEPHHDSAAETTIGDVTDYATVRAATMGQDAVVHLGMPDFVGGPDTRSLGWSAGFGDSCQAIANVLEAAVAEEVDTVVYASSNHAVGMYEVQHAPEIYGPETNLTLDHTVRPRPDSRYGVVKVFGEAMAQLTADAHGINCYALRICSVRDPEYDHPYGDAERGVDNGTFERDSEAYERQVARQQCMWQSRRDLAQQVDRCLERGVEQASSREENGHDAPGEFDVFYGRSASDRSWFDLDHARETIGYEPADDATAWDSPPE
ncbi:NAD(P)-dependent oxidoreductase [Halobacteria archaeon AArc-curdl1]|uniref:NAD(P)-dependent oxidoreductase n=1 Tax=Natronosalvus hydrolyticus TaxID=2979988 RepID=A0AAP2Z8S6_9EURY|nr:NAD(P)-dependent oxidoreductase [Halobacteria archaeon AArc-curdl1]